FDVERLFAADLDRCTVREIRPQHIRRTPFQIPSVADGNCGVPSRHYVGQCEGAIAVALIAAEEAGIVGDLLWDEYDHYTRNWLVTIHDSSVNGSYTLGYENRKFDRLRACNLNRPPAYARIGSGDAANRITGCVQKQGGIPTRKLRLHTELSALIHASSHRIARAEIAELQKRILRRRVVELYRSVNRLESRGGRKIEIAALLQIQALSLVAASAPLG